MDLSLDLNPLSTTHGRLRVLNGDLVLTSDENPAGSNYILQHILQRLRLCAGEWFLNTTLGVPYLQRVMVKHPNQAAVDTMLQNVILATPGVRRLTAWRTTKPARRVLRVDFAGAAINGPFSYAGPLNTPTDQVVQ